MSTESGNLDGLGSPVKSIEEVPRTAPIRRPLPSQQQIARVRAIVSVWQDKWNGKSVRTSNGSITQWENCNLHFNSQNGRITGRGESVWNGERIPFQVQGCFNVSLTEIELIKNHFNEQTTSSLNLTKQKDDASSVPNQQTVPPALDCHPPVSSTHYSLKVAGQGHLRGVYVFGTVDLFKVVDAIVVSTNVPGGNEMARSFGPISPAMMRSRGPGCGGTFGAPPGLRPSLSSYSSNAGSRTNTSYQHFWSVPSTPNLSQCDDVKTFAQVPLHAESKSGLATPSDSLMQAINLNSLVNASLFSNVGPCSTLHNAAEVSRVDLTKAKCDTVEPMRAFLSRLFALDEAQSFCELMRKNEIEWDTFQMLKESNLTEMGVKMGPRLKIIAALNGWNSDFVS